MDINISLVDRLIAAIRMLGSDFINIRRAGIKNWWSAFLFKYGFVQKTRFKTLDREYQIGTEEDYNNFWKESSLYLANNYKIKHESGKLTVYLSSDYPEYYNKGTIMLTYGDEDMRSDAIRQVRDIFYNKEYSFMSPQGKVVVDIGANIGDTALFFVLRGAKKVYSVEAMPRLYDLLVQNVKLNKVNNVVAINAVATTIEKDFKLPELNMWAGDIQETKKHFVTVKPISLEDIEKMYPINDALLKVDIEGGEYTLIKNTKIETLRKFGEIVIEYHYGYKDLVHKLKQAGFRVTHTAPTKTVNKALLNPIMYAGFIVAIKD